MKLKYSTRFLTIFFAGILVFTCLLLLSVIIYLRSCKALGKTGVVVASVLFLLVCAILIAGMVVVIAIAFRSRKKKVVFSDRMHLLLWMILLPALFAINLIGLPFLQDCLEGNEITQQFIVREIYMNGHKSGTVLIASAAQANRKNVFDTRSFYDDVYDPDSSIIYFYSGSFANRTFMRAFFDSAGIGINAHDWVMTSTDTQILYATITYYPRTHAILAYRDVKTVPVAPTA